MLHLFQSSDIFRIRLLLTCFFCSTIFFSLQLAAQEVNTYGTFEYYDKAYGLDELLYNGKIYAEDRDRPLGNPFLDLPASSNATAIINGKAFHQLSILYDCYKQNFILEFQNSTGSKEKLLLQNELIDTIVIAQHVFIKNIHPDIKNTFIQLVHNEPFEVYFSWKKEKKFKTAGENAGYYFTKEKREVYCLKDTTIYRVKGRRDFVNLFPDSEKKTIHRKLKQEKISIRKINAMILRSFLTSLETI